VDLTRLAPPAAPSAPSAPKPKGLAASEAVLPRAAGRSYLLPSLEERRKAAAAKLAELEEQTRRAVAAKLRDVYRRELDSLFADRQKALEGLSRELDQRLQGRISEAFLRYADRHGRALSEIAVAFGYPDSGGDPPPPQGAWARAMARRLEAARKERDAARDAFRREVSELAASLGQQYAEEAGKLALELESRRAEADRHADEEAARVARGYGSSLRSLLAGAEQVIAPSVPERRVLLPPVSAPPPAPKAPPRPGSDAALAARLELWAGWNGYKLTSDPTKGRDATEEFARWLESNPARR